VIEEFTNDMRSTRQGSVAPPGAAPSGGDNVIMQQLMETMRALQEVVVVDIVASQANNEELRRTYEELRRNLQQAGECTVYECAPPIPPRARPMPFSQAIMDTALPTTSLGLKVTFTSVEDPEAHLTVFHTQMMLTGGFDVVYCKLLMNTLADVVLELFFSLPHGHITTFDQFAMLFREQYLINGAPPRISYDVFEIKQYQGESLKEFLNRFGVQLVRLKPTDEPMTVHAFTKEMLPGPFSESLLRFYPKTFCEIMRRALAHIAAEDRVTEKCGFVDPVRPRAAGRPQPLRVHEATTEKKGSGKQQPYEKPQIGARTRRDPPPKHNFCVELKELIVIPNIAARLKMPPKTYKKMGPNKNAWCEFHQAYGHPIRNCLALGYQLDELVKSGFLKDYLQEPQEDQALVAAGIDQGHEVPIHGEINTISGGFSEGGCTASQRKKYAREVMAVEVQETDNTPDVDLVFTKADRQDVIPHDNDPVVISVITAGRRVHRVLVDLGNSIDVMFWSTFNKLQLSPDQMRPYTGCLYGFAGDQVEVRGHIALRTTFTDGTTSRTANIRYLVVNTLSTYNILLGRPALNRIGVVASTTHMKMKLPSLEGTAITIKSNQKEAKKCF